MINDYLVHKTFGDWKVHITGDISNEKNGSEITFDRLTETDWIRHAIGLEWGFDFIKAFYEAVTLVGLESITHEIIHK